MLAPVLVVLLTVLAGAGTAPAPTAEGPVLAPHPPILIEGNDDVCAPASGVVNCDSATGTCASPYRIAGWSIASSDALDLPAITIRDTTVCIVVEANALETPADVGLSTVRLESVRDVTLAGNTISTGTATGVVVLDSARVTLSDNALTAAGAAGAVDLARVTGTSDLAVVANTFTALTAARAHVADFVDVASSPGARFEGNDYSSANAVAVRLADSPSASFVSERVRELFGVYVLQSSPGVVVDGLDADLVSAGIAAVGSGTLTMRASSLGDDFPCAPTCWLPPVGVSLTTTSLSMRNTTVSDFAVGLDASHPGDWMDIRCITLTGNDAAIRVNDLGSSSVEQSNFVGNAVAIENTGTSTYQAKNNWWGTPAGPSPTAFVGKVHASPWLQAPAACAPPA